MIESVDNHDNKGKKSEMLWKQIMKKKKIIILVILGLLLVAILVGAGWYLTEKYTVTTVYVEGNVHYSQEDIQDMVMTGPLGNNSLYLSLKYKNKEIKNVPFVDSMSVQILAPDKIRIFVYEKALAGFVKFMNSNMYFDKDGYVVESSQIITRGIPEISGLSFESVTLGQKLPVEDDKVFERIMSLTNLLNKYQLYPDRILFQQNGQEVLYFGSVRVALGEHVKMEEKLMNLPQFLEKLQGKGGILHLENYTGNNESIQFELDKPKEEE